MQKKNLQSEWALKMASMLHVNEDLVKSEIKSSQFLEQIVQSHEIIGT